MVYKVLYEGDEVLRITSNLKLTMEELVKFVYHNPKTAYENKVPGFCTDGCAYGFDFDNATLCVTPGVDDDNDEVRYFCRYV